MDNSLFEGSSSTAEYMELIQFLNTTAHDLFAQTDVNAGIRQMLIHVREYFRADRSYVIENDYTTNTSTNTYEICADGISSEMARLHDIPFDSFRFWFDTFKEHHYLNIPDVEQLGDDRCEERELLRTQNIQSLLSVPLYRDKILIGFLGVDNPKDKNLHVDRLTVLGDYLAICLMGRDNLVTLQNENAMFSGIMNYIPGGVGVYSYYTDGRLEQNFLNDGYYSMLGVSRKDRSRYNGFSALDAVYPADVHAVMNALKLAVEHNTLVDLDIRVLTGGKEYVWLNVKARLAARTEEKCTMYAFYSNINLLKKAQLQLSAQQKATSLASDSGGIVFWMYDIDKKEIKTLFGNRITRADDKQAAAEEEIWLDPGNVYKPDTGTFNRMHAELEYNAESSKCTVRVMNNRLKRYEWRHIYYTRLHDELYVHRTAIGFSVSADLEQENRQHYERELLLRKEMIKNAVIYSQLNLTQGIVEECQTIPADFLGVQPGDKLDDIYIRKMMGAILEEDRTRVQNTIGHKALMKAFMEGETSANVIFRAVFPDRGVRWVQISVTITEHYASGDILAFMFAYNIDAQKKDQLAIEAIMDEEIESVVVIDVETGQAHFAQFNVEYEDINTHDNFEYDKTYCEIIHSYVYEKDQQDCENFFYIAKMVEALKKEPVIKLMYRTLNRQGTIYRKKTRAFYLDSTHREIIMIRRDITDLYEEEQRQKHILQKAVDEANKANRAKSEFLSRMSHDMRTPLNAVLSFSGKEITGSATEEQLRGYLEKIHSSGDYLLGIINDVLDMARIEQNKMILNCEPYAMDDFTEIVRTVIGESCTAKDIRLFLDCRELSGKWLNVDKVRFNQVFMNLLSNAVKFTRQGGQIDLVIQKADEKKGSWIFIVRDNGIGMSKKFIPKAFESFSQENNRLTQNNPGTGLGLSIVKKIIDLMNGTIRLESELDKGTVFTIELPLDIVQAPEKQKINAASEINLEGIRILLCEDNDINAEIAQVLLEEKKCIVEWAGDGKIGLQMFQESELYYYQAILMDIRMPVMDGYEATRAIRNLKRTDAQTVPIIAMTADAFAQDEQSSLEVGMNAHLSKPIDSKALFYTLGEMLARSKEHGK